MTESKPRMRKYAIGVPGEPVRMTYSCKSQIDLDAQLMPGEVAIEVSEDLLDHAIHKDGSTISPRVKTKAERNREAWRDAKVDRSAKLKGGFGVEGIGWFDSDEDSLNRLARHALRASLDHGYVTQWTTADNKRVTLTAVQLLQIFSASVEFEDQLFHESAEVRKFIFSKD